MAFGPYGPIASDYPYCTITDRRRLHLTTDRSYTNLSAFHQTDGYGHATMIEITLNGERNTLPQRCPCSNWSSRSASTRASRRRGQSRGRAQPRHAERRSAAGDAVEIVTLVGGGSTSKPPADKPLKVGKFHVPVPAHHRHRQVRQLRPDARLPGRQRLRGDDGGRAPRTADRQGRPQHPRFPRSEEADDPAQHRRLLQRRGRDPPCPPGPRAA